MGLVSSEIFSVAFYKSKQSRLLRVVLAVLFGGVLLAAMFRVLSLVFEEASELVLILRVLAFCLSSVIACFAYNNRVAADFLIGTQVEVGRVVWPTYEYVRRALCVIIAVVLVLVLLILLMDFVWRTIFRLIGFLVVG